MTTATIANRSMAFQSNHRAPLHQRVWDLLVSVGAQRAANHLRREAMLRGNGQPELSRQLLDAANHITVK